MSAELSSMLAHRLRKLATTNGDSMQIAEAMKALLERERHLHQPALAAPAAPLPIAFPARPLLLAAEN